MQLRARPVLARFCINREKRLSLFCRTFNRDGKSTILSCSGFHYTIKNNNAKYFIWIWKYCCYHPIPDRIFPGVLWIQPFFYLIGVLQYLFMEHEVVLTVLLPCYIILVTFVSTEKKLQFLDLCIIVFSYLILVTLLWTSLSSVVILLDRVRSISEKTDIKKNRCLFLAFCWLREWHWFKKTNKQPPKPNWFW